MNLAKSSIASQLKSVLYKDKGMLVLNKLPGLTCQLATGLQKKYELASPLRPVHRLDVGTTGCLTLAVTQRAAQEMSRQFAQGTVHKTYLALVRGDSRSFLAASGRVTDPIRYHDGYFDGLGEGGEPSVTEWELLAESPIAPLSLVRLKLVTGHKHQLRIHLAKSLQAPILGDQRYSTSPIHESISRQVHVPSNRMFLHASRFSLLKYRSGGPQKRFRLGIQAPLPADWVGLCQKLKLPIPSSEVNGGLSINGEPIQDTEIAGVDGRWLLNEQRRGMDKLPF
ncbi:pseudouridine synthase [Coprinellus micaceus]|uniref:21S rRNA pseudouridine(2819) synthase n=1 Tax=Coprinellus micaceus TaxID=71717 RepID=A0A4Y7TI79_COPMI|nr:pseudouridine synthase [Coprinellus micaceus]